MAFLLWGWALLLLVLFSAAPTAAQPMARSVGSAFDPSTVSVTVGPSKRDESGWIKKLRSNDADGDAPDRSATPLLAANVHDAQVAGGPALDGSFGRRASPVTAPDAGVRSPPARAPPPS